MPAKNSRYRHSCGHDVLSQTRVSFYSTSCFCGRRVVGTRHALSPVPREKCICPYPPCETRHALSLHLSPNIHIVCRHLQDGRTMCALRRRGTPRLYDRARTTNFLLRFYKTNSLLADFKSNSFTYYPPSQNFTLSPARAVVPGMG